jgi:hypothetical protein
MAKRGRKRKLIRNIEYIRERRWVSIILFWNFLELDKEYLDKHIWKGEKK